MCDPVTVDGFSSQTAGDDWARAVGLMDPEDWDRLLALRDTAALLLPEEPDPPELPLPPQPREETLVRLMADQLAQQCPERMSGAGVRLLRESLGLTQFDFAQYGLAYRSVTQWEWSRKRRLSRRSTREVLEAVARRLVQQAGRTEQAA